MLCRVAVFLFATIAAVAQALQFAVIGDAGTGGRGQRAVCLQMERYAQTYPWEFVLALGDNIYENGEERHFGPKFKDIYRNLTNRGIRFHSTLGNHDRRNRGGMAQVADDAFGYIDRQDEYVLEAGTIVNGRRLVGNAAWPDLKRVIDYEIGYAAKHGKPGEACCEVKLPIPGAK